MRRKGFRRREKKSKLSPRKRTGDYRIFVGAFLSGELAEQVQAMREQYDPKTAQISAPHVTLAGTYWRSGAATAKKESPLIEKLETQAASLSKFNLTLGGIYTFGSRVVYLGVAQTEALQATRRALLNIMGRDKHRKFKPHLTLAMRLEEPEMTQMVTTLQTSKWHTEQFTAVIESLHLMQRGKQDAAWRSIYEIPLE